MPTSEVELKLLVPAASRAAVSAEMARASSTLERTWLTAVYLDTPDRRLAHAGLSWRLRREGRRWVQTLQTLQMLKAAGRHAAARFEHEAIRPDATHDATAHAGTPAGKRLAELLRRAQADGLEVGARFKSEVRRTTRRVRVRGATVALAFDEGKLTAGDTGLRLCEVEFQRVSGTMAAVLALAERWCKRFGLVYEPRTLAQRGDLLADGERFPPVRKANRLSYSNRATASEALGAVLDECLAQVTLNAIGLTNGDPALRAEHVHQLRIGVRRLRSALRSFAGWTPPPPVGLVDGLQSLFGTLGQSRDIDVLRGGVAAELARVGAPHLALSSPGGGLDVAHTVRDEAVQRVFLGWLAWRLSLTDQSGPQASVGAQEVSGTAPEQAPAWPEIDPRKFHRGAEQRLRRWHRRIAADWERFDELDGVSLHALRKRIKRQRYAVEFFAPMLPRHQVDRYMKPLAILQDRMGELNDLSVAKARYQALVAGAPEAWFALGWITARIAEVRASVRSDLGMFVKVASP